MAVSLPRTRIIPVGEYYGATINEVELIFSLPVEDEYTPSCVKKIVEFHQNQTNLPRSVMRYFSGKDTNNDIEMGTFINFTVRI